MAAEKLTADDIKALAADLRTVGTDTSSVEAKAAKREAPKALYATYSSFSNTHGGLILLGLDEQDDFAITGVTNSKKVADDASSMCSEMEPAIYPDIDIVPVDGANVIVIDVSPLETTMRPCYRRATGAERGTYIRRHDGDVRAPLSLVHLMIAEKRQPRDDLDVVEGATLDDFDERRVKQVVDSLRYKGTGRPYAGMDDNEILLHLNAIIEAEGEYVPTVAGILALARGPRTPQRFLGRVHLAFTKQSSEEELAMGQRLGGKETFEGSIPDMADEAMSFLREELAGAVLVSEEGKRTTQLLYPHEALREAIVNALVHRSLRPDQRQEASTIELWPDRLTVRNPGGLYGLSEEELPGLETKPQSKARNSALVGILELIRRPSDDEPMLEARGTGIRTMFRSLRGAGMRRPIFHDDPAFFEVSFSKHSLLNDETQAWLDRVAPRSLSHEQRLALALARKEGRVDNSTVRQITGNPSVGDISGQLGNLVDRKLLRRINTKRWAYYELRETSSTGRTRQDQRERILTFLDEHGPAGTDAIANHVEISRRSVQRWLNRMEEEGTITPSSQNRTDPNLTWERVATTIATTLAATLAATK